MTSVIGTDPCVTDTDAIYGCCTITRAKLPHGIHGLVGVVGKGHHNSEVVAKS